MEGEDSVSVVTLRVFMLTYHYWPGPEGGTERQCRKLVHALSRRGIVSTVITTRAYRCASWIERDGEGHIVRFPTCDGFLRFQPSKTNVDTLETASPSKPLLPPGRMSQITSQATEWLNALLFQIFSAMYLIFRAKQFHILHVHSSDWIAGFAVWMGRFLKKPVLCKVATIPALPVLNRNVPFRSLWDRSRRRAEFVALNGAMAEDLIDEGIDDRQIHLIPNGIELPPIRSRREKADFVLFVGNLTQSAWKAFDVLFEAWTQVAEACPSARLVVLGRGDPTPWERYLQERGCRESVRFKGFVRDVDSFYRLASLLVLPSRQEGMSNVLLEALSWGIPAVVSDISGNRSVVDDGKNGLIVPANDADALAKGIIRLLQDSPLRCAMGIAARQKAESSYNIESVAEKTQKVYHKLMHS